MFWCAAGAAAAEAYIDSVPLPEAPLEPQAAVLYYRDGRTILARVGTVDHSDVPLSAVPVPVRQAVLAAEDRSFYEHSGVSPRGIARAAVAVANGSSQGASTVTQQYARNAFLTQEFSATRKTKEMALAIKLERRYGKDEILQRYLNTIYYGRGAYGIAAAAHAYFDTTTERLTLAQGAVIAAVIKDPWHLDPANDPEGAKTRWAWVLDSMRQVGWIDKATVDAQRYPQVRPRLASADKLDGPNGLVVDQVERELGRHGITPQALHTTGISVVTTLDPVAQTAALDLVGATLKAQPPKLRAALVAIEPATGEVRAYYGGDRGRGYFDDALAARPPASTFKPISLTAAMLWGIGYESRWDGSSPRDFPDRYGAPLYNADNQQCPDCTLETAMVKSLNTPFYALTQKMGGRAVRELAVQLGISETYEGKKSMVDVKGDPAPGRTRADIALGRYPVTPADLASVYATFASGGIRCDRHFVRSVTGPDGKQLWKAQPQRRQVLPPAVAADLSTVLRTVVDAHNLTPDRAAAGKTGTQQWGDTDDNQDAWMAGYTPQLAVAVWMGRSIPGPIRDANGKPIAGETVPGRLWRDFLIRALDDMEEEAFPLPAHVGLPNAGDAKRITGGTPPESAGAERKQQPDPKGTVPPDKTGNQDKDGDRDGSDDLRGRPAPGGKATPTGESGQPSDPASFDPDSGSAG